MTNKLSTSANFTMLMDAAKRYLRASKPHWPIDQMSGQDLINIGYRLAELKAQGDFRKIIDARNTSRQTKSILSGSVGSLVFKHYDPRLPTRNLMRRSNLRRRSQPWRVQEN